MTNIDLRHGDCLDVLAELADASVDAVVTDPPYGLANTDPAHVADTIVRWVNGDRDYLPGGAGFMGKAWDAFVPPVAVWDECLRVLKPGGHVLAFAGSRTVDLMTLGLRLAGFDIRDSIAWLYGSGFPKSLDVSKAIDKARDDKGDILAVATWLSERRIEAGVTIADINRRMGLDQMARWWFTDRLDLCQCPTWEQWRELKALLGFGDEMDAEVMRLNGRKGTLGEAWEQREVLGYAADRRGDGTVIGLGHSGELNRATSDAARTWQGWGTALKPAFEPIVVARKPLQGTVAANVLQHGTGALNIDACRVGGAPPAKPQPSGVGGVYDASDAGRSGVMSEPHAAGRWPANVVLDETQATALDQQSGELTSGGGIKAPEGKTHGFADGRTSIRHDFDKQYNGDQGGASRFFYIAKADASERPFIFRPTCECEDAWPTHTPSAARATDATTEPGSSSTSKSGSVTTGDQSPTATRSTTSTATSSTTTPTTSSPSPLPTTSASTPAANSETVSGGSPAGSAASSSRSASLTGISAAKGGRNTDDAAPATSRAWSKTSVCGNCGAPARREAHATVKPLALMRWLVRLVTPPGGTVLEPFAGSGTTVEACILEGFSCVAIEREADYLPLIRQRIARRRDPVQAVKATGDDGGLFDLLEDGGAA